MGYLLEDEHNICRFNKEQAIDYIADKLHKGELLIILLDELRMTYSGSLSTAANTQGGHNSAIFLAQDESAKKITPALVPAKKPVVTTNVESPKAIFIGNKPAKYGGKTTVNGGRDSTQAVIYKDPATCHLDNEPARRAIFDNGVLQPLAGTRGKAKAIPKSEEAGAVATRNCDNRTYLLNKDENGMPEFTIFETYLGNEHINSSDEGKHFEAANKRLGELLTENPELKIELGLTDKQYQHFTKNPPTKKNVKGLTWHHHQATGKMQLVDKGLHGAFGHVGGMECWGGGRGK